MEQVPHPATGHRRAPACASRSTDKAFDQVDRLLALLGRHLPTVLTPATSRTVQQHDSAAHVEIEAPDVHGAPEPKEEHQ